MSEELTLEVDGMACDGCEDAVETAVQREVGELTIVDADHRAGLVSVDSPDPIESETIEDAVVDAGFEIPDEDDEEE